MAAVSSSVQFIGADAVVQAYDMQEIPAWALYQNRQLLFRYEGASMDEGTQLLSKVFEMISNSPAVYTLKVYEDLNGAKITDKLAYNGSFNFRLSEPAAVGSVSANGEVVALLKEMHQTNKEIRERLEFSDSEVDPGGAMGVIGYVKEVMTIPGVAEAIGGIISRLFNPVSVAQPAAIGAAPVSQEPNPTMEMTQAEANRVLSAYMVIVQRMPKAAEMLEKLAEISTTNPSKFESIKAAINMFL